MLLCCLAYGGMTSCSGKKSDADEQDKGKTDTAKNPSGS